MDQITPYLLSQIKKHSSIGPQDIVKQCYQAAFGAEHLMVNPEDAKHYFDEEYSQIIPRDGELTEAISEEVCRVNMAVWKYRKMPPQELYELFIKSAGTFKSDLKRFIHYLLEAERLVKENKTKFTLEDWNAYMKLYEQLGIHPVHHSREYVQAEKPAYRIVKNSLFQESQKP